MPEENSKIAAVSSGKPASSPDLSDNSKGGGACGTGLENSWGCHVTKSEASCHANIHNHKSGNLTSPISLVSEKMPERWLVVRLSSLGDVVLCTGVMRYLHEQYGWSFSVLTRKAFAPLFEHCPFVKEVIAAEHAELNLPRSLIFFRDVARKYRSWGLMDWHGSLRSHILSMFWRGPVKRYPKMRKERQKFLQSRSHELAELLRGSSVTQRYALAVLASSPERSALLPQVWLTDKEQEAARQALANIFGKERKPLLALHPYATHSLKTWPRDYWLELIEKLSAKGMAYFIVGQGEPLLPDSKADFTGRTSLRELAALVGEADILITGDSGPMHLAGAVNTPVLALFGPTTPEWGFAPAGDNDMVLELDLKCRPCSLHGAGSKQSCSGRCLKDISPDTVLATAQDMLKRLGSCQNG